MQAGVFVGRTCEMAALLSNLEERSVFGYGFLRRGRVAWRTRTGG